MNVDRHLQKQLLSELKTRYPGQLAHPEKQFPNVPSEVLHAQLIYLAEHGLTEVNTASGISSIAPTVVAVRLTARGIDFLEDDGGLTAILGVVTVKLHEDDLLQLVEARIQQLPAAPADKKRFLDQLRSLPADAIRQVVLELVKQGLAHAPNIPELMRTLGKWFS